jgi:hypothetical protein
LRPGRVFFSAVSAIKDADKTFNAPHDDRLFVGYINEFLAA